MPIQEASTFRLRRLRERAIDAFRDAAMERADEMRDQFDVDDDPVVAEMWAMIKEMNSKLGFFMREDS